MFKNKRTLKRYINFMNQSNPEFQEWLAIHDKIVLSESIRRIIEENRFHTIVLENNADMVKSYDKLLKLVIRRNIVEFDGNGIDYPTCDEMDEILIHDLHIPPTDGRATFLIINGECRHFIERLEIDWDFVINKGEAFQR